MPGRMLQLCTGAALLVVPLCSLPLSFGLSPSQAWGGHGRPWRNLRSVHGVSHDSGTPTTLLKARVPTDSSRIPTKLKLKLITSEISTCLTASGVLSVLRGESPAECDDIVIASAIYRLAYTKATFQRHLAEDKAFRVLLKRAQQMLQRSEMGVRALSNMMWALAAARSEIPEFQRLTPYIVHELMEQHCDELEPQGAANALWGMASLWHYVPHIRETLQVHDIAPKLAEKAACMRDRFKFQEYVNLLLAVALLQEDVPSVIQLVPPLIESLAGKVETEAFLERDPTYTIVGFGRLVDALAALGYKHQPFLDSLAQDIMRTPLDRSPASLINVCCGFAQLGFRNKRLLNRLAKIRWNWDSRSDWDVAALAWTFRANDTEGARSKMRRSAHAEASRRGLTEAQIEHSRFGYMFWDDFNPNLS